VEEYYTKGEGAASRWKKLIDANITIADVRLYRGIDVVVSHNGY
jgi:hypothetical protein